MSDMKEYTLELYRADKRTREGRRLYSVEDFAESTEVYINAVAEGKRRLGFIVEVHETWVTRKNMMGGREYRERYDTPNFCSPSSEAYWSM